MLQLNKNILLQNVLFFTSLLKIIKIIIKIFENKIDNKLLIILYYKITIKKVRIIVFKLTIYTRMNLLRGQAASWVLCGNDRIWINTLELILPHQRIQRIQCINLNIYAF